MSLYSKNLEVCWDTQQALGLCRVTQEWNCILCSKMYWEWCLQGGLTLVFERAERRSSKQNSTLTLCVRGVTWSSGEVLFKHFSLIPVACMTPYSSFCGSSSSKLTRTVNLGYVYNLSTCELAKSCGTCPADIPQKGKNPLGRLCISSSEVWQWKWTVDTEL